MKKTAIIFLALACSLSVHAQVTSDEAAGTNFNKPEREEWLRDLGFGMFIHWSFDSQLGVVISHSMVGASEDYMNRFINELPQTFLPDEFDAYKIARQAKLAGMKYVVFTTKHHSGFCMWDTKTTDFNITNTPYGKDVVKEYVEGVRKAGLAVGFYYSPEDFKFLYENNITVRRRGLNLDDAFLAKYNDFIRQQTNELFSNYGEIDVLFIDGNPNEACKDEAWKLQPNLVITRGAVNTPEQRLPGLADDNLWESCVTMGTQWQYKPTNDELKSAGRLIEILIETRAKGGNLLLNVGPDPYGKIPDPEVRNLTEIAAWHFVNQEAVNAVRPWIITHEENIWFTSSKDRKTVYAIITGIPDWPRGARKEFVLGSVRATSDTKISVLGQNDLVVEYNPDNIPTSRFKQTDGGLTISVVRAQRLYNNHKWPNPITVKLENVVPALDPPVIVTGDASVSGKTVSLQGKLAKKGNVETIKVGFEYRLYAGFTEYLYGDKWEKTSFIDIAEEKEYSVKTDKLEPGKTYEYRAVVVHPQMSIYGDVKRVTAGQ
ncbi:MAG: alpha-L-fucosidase [Cyclobacteriaceae bacterium]|nr:alpha-L-fucosidase [Cyclobacteriaceae bacterium]